MKQTVIICFSALLSTVGCQSQSDEVNAIKETAQRFSKAGDANNVEELSAVLDENYRIVMNQLFGSKEVSVVPRSVYLQKIQSKEWGGDSRKLTFGTITVNGNSACAQVVMTGKKSTFRSLLILIKDGEGNWKLISDLPVVE